MMEVVRAMGLRLAPSDGLHGIDGLKRGEAGGQHCAGLVSGSADGGFVFGQNRAWKDGGEDLAFVFCLR